MRTTSNTPSPRSSPSSVTGIRASVTGRISPSTEASIGWDPNRCREGPGKRTGAAPKAPPPSPGPPGPGAFLGAGARGGGLVLRSVGERQVGTPIALVLQAADRVDVVLAGALAADRGVELRQRREDAGQRLLEVRRDRDIELVAVLAGVGLHRADDRRVDLQRRRALDVQEQLLAALAVERRNGEVLGLTEGPTLGGTATDLRAGRAGGRAGSVQDGLGAVLELVAVEADVLGQVHDGARRRETGLALGGLLRGEDRVDLHADRARGLALLARRRARREHGAVRRAGGAEGGDRNGGGQHGDAGSQSGSLLHTGVLLRGVVSQGNVPRGRGLEHDTTQLVPAPGETHTNCGKGPRAGMPPPGIEPGTFGL